jgi:small subunit ribosomal protein S6
VFITRSLLMTTVVGYIKTVGRLLMANAKLRRYELIYLIQPEAEEEQRTRVSESVAAVLTEAEALIIQNEEWGKRKLAYEIEKFNKAYYYYLEFVTQPGLTHEIERRLRLLDDCVRFQTIKLEDGIDPDNLDRFTPVATDDNEESGDEAAEVA